MKEFAEIINTICTAVLVLIAATIFGDIVTEWIKKTAKKEEDGDGSGTNI